MTYTLAIFGDAGNSLTNGTSFYYSPGKWARYEIGASALFFLRCRYHLLVNRQFLANLSHALPMGRAVMMHQSASSSTHNLDKRAIFRGTVGGI